MACSFSRHDPPAISISWGRLNNVVYKTNPCTLEELKHNISHEINNINRGELQWVNFIKRYQKWLECSRTVPAPPSIKLISMTICKIPVVLKMWLVVSPRSYTVRYPPRVCQQCTVKSPLLLSTLVLISLYKEECLLVCCYTRLQFYSDLEEILHTWPSI